MAASFQSIKCKLSGLWPSFRIIGRHDEDRIERLAVKHLPMIRVAGSRTELPCKCRRSVRIKITHRDEVDRGVLKRGVHVAEGVSASANECGAELVLVLEVVPNVILLLWFHDSIPSWRLRPGL